MSAVSKARLICRCSGCETVFQLTVSQLSARAGLVRCGDCSTVFNATWNLVDEVPNPTESITPVALEPAISTTPDQSQLENLHDPDTGPGFANGERLFSLDDQLRHDLQLDGAGGSALEEIRRTLGPADVELESRERRPLPFRPKKRLGARVSAYPLREKTDLGPKTPTMVDSLQSRRRKSISSSSKQRTIATILWTLATITAIAGLFIQVRYVLFEELAVIPSVREPLETFCRVVNCRVPPPLTGPVFRVLQTRVDLDPQLPGAVVVKVHLLNRSTTSRAYPPVQLILTNRDGEIIGRRTYFARDYGQNAAGNQLIPGAVSVVTLHLADPDEKAVGFEATIVEDST